jgi:hypothetical protein
MNEHHPIVKGIATIITGALFLAPFTIAIAIWVGLSCMEARAYNRVTGADVTTFEAMWIQLRVQEGSDRRRDD